MMREIILNGKKVNDESDAYVIAEISGNHGGSLELCKEMIESAQECGCDAVKLVKRTNRELYTDEYFNKPYDNPNSFGATYGEHREALEFDWEQYCELKKFAFDLDITLFATPFDIPAADFLNELKMPIFKIASGDLTNIPLIKYVAGFDRPMIISTGGSRWEDIIRAEESLREGVKIAWLQCTAAYPAKIEQMQLRVIEEMREFFPSNVIGLSDHYGGILSGPIAYIFGARIFEKHFTFGHAMKGTDHAFSLKPDRMKRFVTDLRRTKWAMADVKKEPLPEEAEPIRKMAKAVYLNEAV
ncbi:hypothetical protein LCGC14_2841570, partial [marine sediment metagenome]